MSLCRHSSYADDTEDRALILLEYLRRVADLSNNHNVYVLEYFSNVVTEAYRLHNDIATRMYETAVSSLTKHFRSGLVRPFISWHYHLDSLYGIETKSMTEIKRFLQALDSCNINLPTPNDYQSERPF